MFLDDSEPKKKPELVFRRLDTLSVEALKEYIMELQQEIKRTETEIARRSSARNMAEAFFKASF